MKYLEELKQALENEDFYKTDQILDKIKAEEDAKSYIEPLLHFMEENPDIDYGAPGAVVHFMESIDGYENLLIESINRTPISHTIWMLNRIINGAQNKNRKKYFELMKKQLKRSDVSDNLKEEIEDFVDFQEERGEF